MHELSDFWPFFVTFGMLVAAGFGAPIPEEIPTVGAGVWVGSHPELGPLRWLILPVCFLGVLISDVMLYGIGRRWGPSIMKQRWAQKMIPPDTWGKIQANYHRHGITTLLLVRWIPAIRSPMFLSAGVMRLSLVRFVLADGIAVVFGHTVLFFLAWWFGDQFQELVERAEQRVDRLKPLIVVVALAAVGGFLMYHFLRRPVSTGDPKELPVIGNKVMDTIEHVTLHDKPAPAKAPDVEAPEAESKTEQPESA
ncbi:MAG: DedA family protein [Gemmataceae bacterium]|nr:DedA family protein [Gemmataceae bacterium]